MAISIGTSEYVREHLSGFDILNSIELSKYALHK